MKAGHSVRTRRLATAAVLLSAVNLRPAVTSLGPVLEEARAGLGMSAIVAGLLTAVPALCFALIGFVAAPLARRYGPNAVIAAGTGATVAGLATRSFAAGPAAFLALSAVALAGIAVVNVLLPAVVKEYFPDRVGTMTGLYAMALNVGASAAAAATAPLASVLGGGWRGSLGAWAALAAIAVPPWLALTRDRPAVPAAHDAPPGPSLSRNPTAWALTVYFGLQATAAYVIIGWLPQLYRDAGLPAGTAGLLFAVTSLLGVPLSFVLAAVAGRVRHQGGIVAVLGAFALAGYAGLWGAPASTAWLSAVLLGVANGSFPLALTMIGLRGRDSATVVQLSAFTQSRGYLLSMPGPLVVAALYDHTGTWRAPLVFLAVLMVPQVIAGLFAGRDRQIG
jgi:CP family cyanate transporter-like MFS transporter